MATRSTSGGHNLTVLLGGEPDAFASKVIGVVGSGGKTSLLSYLAHAFAERGRRVLLTTSTKVHPFPGVETLTDPAGLPEAFAARSIVCLGRRLSAEGKIEGDPSLDMGTLRQLADVVLVEGDGARRRPLKIHLPHDPALTDGIDLAFVLVGARAVDRPAIPEILHRCQRIPGHWPLRCGDVLSATRIVDLVLRPEGYLSKAGRAPLRLLVNQADAHPEAARQLSTELAQRWPGPVLLGSAQRGRFAAVDSPGPRASLLLLAAGRGDRFGGDKRRFTIKDRPLLDWSLAAYERARVLERMVVLGAEAADGDLAALALRRGFRPVHLPREGTQVESLQAGLRVLSRGAESVLVALGDMPAVRPATIDALLAEGRRQSRRCLRPTWRGRPGHPVSIPRELFPRLLALGPCERAGDLLADLDPFPLECSDPGVILDLDSPAQAGRIVPHLHDPREESETDAV